MKILRATALSGLFLSASLPADASVCGFLLQFFQEWKDRSDQREIRELSARILEIHRKNAGLDPEATVRSFRDQKQQLETTWIRLFSLLSRQPGDFAVFAPRVEDGQAAIAVIPRAELQHILARHKREAKRFQFQVRVRFPKSMDSPEQEYIAEAFELIPANLPFPERSIDREVQLRMLDYWVIRKGREAVGSLRWAEALAPGTTHTPDMEALMREVVAPDDRPQSERDPSYLLKSFQERLLLQDLPIDQFHPSKIKARLLGAFLATNERGLFLVISELRELKQESSTHYEEAVQFLERHLKRNIAPHFHKDVQLIRAAEAIARILGERRLDPMSLAGLSKT